MLYLIVLHSFIFLFAIFISELIFISLYFITIYITQGLSHCPTTHCALCKGLTLNQYRCQGCDTAIRWFCSLGDYEVNQSKGHGAHYWCLAGYTSKGPGAASLLPRKCGTTSMTAASSSSGQKQGSATAKKKSSPPTSATQKCGSATAKKKSSSPTSAT
jgi:hypothetical protein